jgi:5-methylcytosine-specific restriction protein A
MQPCSQPGCPELVEKGYCDGHRSQNRPERHGQDIYNTKRWKNLRKRKLALDPICESCMERLAEHVHHIKEIYEYPELKWDMCNLESICRQCHGKETNREVRERTFK